MPLVVAVVAADEEEKSSEERDSVDSDMPEMISEITDVAEARMDEIEEETAETSAVAEGLETSQGISEGTTTPAVLQMLPAKAMAAAWSAAEHSAWRQLREV